MIELDAEAMFTELSKYNAKCQRAMQNSKWEDFERAREELAGWFFLQGIRLKAKE